jgi:glucosamine-6-phosphate deaminase
MQTHIFATPGETGAAASRQAVRSLQAALSQRGSARLVLATGASQFDLLSHLVQAGEIDWSRVVCFHLDEYIGLSQNHPASFRKYLRQRFASFVTVSAFHHIQGDAPDPRAECHRVGALLQQETVDLALVGIGENGHLAFNDPPADFKVDDPYRIVDLDEACRRQQVGEGWFPNLESVPTQAISMTIRQIMRSRQIICTVPDLRKAHAVRCSLQGPVTPNCPASILQQHPDCQVYLDEAAASLLAY